MRINLSISRRTEVAPGKNRLLNGIGERAVSVANCGGEFNHKQANSIEGIDDAILIKT